MWRYDLALCIGILNWGTTAVCSSIEELEVAADTQMSEIPGNMGTRLKAE
jgi:hypothetical protein